MKTCKSCGGKKPPSGFYGADSTCKVCRKAKIRQHRRDNIEKVKKYDRNRPNAQKRSEQNKARYQKRVSTEKGRQKEAAYKATWREKNVIKRAAHIIVGNAVRDGRLINPGLCERCGAQESESHHEDYTAPFDVTWLCKTCHGKRHRELNEDIRIEVNQAEKESQTA